MGSVLPITAFAAVLPTLHTPFCTNFTAIRSIEKAIRSTEKAHCQGSGRKTRSYFHSEADLLWMAAPHLTCIWTGLQARQSPSIPTRGFQTTVCFSPSMSSTNSFLTQIWAARRLHALRGNKQQCCSVLRPQSGKIQPLQMNGFISKIYLAGFVCYNSFTALT